MIHTSVSSEEYFTTFGDVAFGYGEVGAPGAVDEDLVDFDVEGTRGATEHFIDGLGGVDLGGVGVDVEEESVRCEGVLFVLVDQEAAIRGCAVPKAAEGAEVSEFFGREVDEIDHHWPT